MIISGEHDHISHEFVYYHTNQHGPQTSLIQYGKADDETASNSSIDVSNNHEDKVENAFTRNSNIAVNRIHEEEIEVSVKNKVKMIDSDESFDVTTPWNTNHDESIDIVPSEKQPPAFVNLDMMIDEFEMGNSTSSQERETEEGINLI